MHSVLEQRKQWQKQYISIGKTDLFYNGMGLCGNFTLFLDNVKKMPFVWTRPISKYITKDHFFPIQAQKLNLPSPYSHHVLVKCTKRTKFNFVGRVRGGGGGGGEGFKWTLKHQKRSSSSAYISHTIQNSSLRSDEWLKIETSAPETL